ncbi:HNH endonuclease [Pedobacter ureilyticus]|uniref:HNH endonuclease n=1 Tax=Pedobacter ureilyticus TaxID=1393051 RepID=A0ABW9JB65_9SPHI|nr:HNH endonuclease [Pedobacter helvus]
MKLIRTPIKPFANYKWRWAVLTPTESLNDPPVFLGVLRVFNEFQSYPPGSPEILRGLGTVQLETNSKVDLVRNKERNLLRNSGQYWRALGLLQPSHGIVSLSPFGKLLADGAITQVEFATTIVKTLELPNRNIEDPTEWDKKQLVIKPLELILDILSFISSSIDDSEGYITPLELRKILIPMAGDNYTIEEYSLALVQFRQGILDISKFPDCTPSSNDKRMAREFLIFLTNYGFCKCQNKAASNDNEKYELASISKEEIVELHNINIKRRTLVEAVREIKITQIPANVERKKVFREVINRPYQNIFRKNTLIQFNYTCVITGVNIDNVLEAAHIIPVSENGSDQADNSLCLRSDIHQLFDSGHLRLFSNGNVRLSDLAGTSNNYGILPSNIQLPEFINRDYLDWRIKYL